MGGRRVGRVLLWLVIVGLSAPSSVTAQTAAAAGGASTDASWFLRAGLARHGLSDGLASPLPQRGTGLLFGIAYGSPGHRGGWGVDLTYWAPRIRSSIATDDGGYEDTHQLDVGFAWVRRVAEVAGGRVGLHLGGAVDVRFSLRSHRYFRWGQRPMVERYGDLFVPLQLTGMWSARVGERGLLMHRLAVPVVTLAARSPYTGLKYVPDLAVEGPNAVTGVDSRLTYRRRAGSSWVVGLFHHMTLIHHPDPRPLSSVVHRLGLELAR